MDWLQALQELRSDGLPGVLATVTEVRGHAPREAGAKMLIGAEALWGSVGGGNLEATVVDRARAMISSSTASPEALDFSLNEHAATEHGKQCCGGVVNVLLEPFLSRPTVAIFGMGHVGHDLARILSRLPLNLHLVDSRAEQLKPERLADITDGVAEVHSHHSPVPDSVLGELPAGTHVFIMTHDHTEDFLLCDAALRRDDLGSAGLIGSKAKWSRFRQRLQGEGHSEAVIDWISCPIGLPEITGKAPAVIAVSVAAQLLQTVQSAAVPADSDRQENNRPGVIPAEDPTKVSLSAPR
ncbi:xanthine dehydrogenase accessory protein XdhC [Pseudarthrobacter sp. N5]|uniref:xanthine dehydrogenase accessory protein XdhC n=1 Tax=Pseudarthrobacter sp. N5 TaxID=3418416 RepID=UPI003CFB0E29